MSQIQLEESWLQRLETEFQQPYMQQLRDFLKAEKAAKKVIFPPSSQWFNALNSTPLEQVKVVILGQDPYHGPDQAHGLSFSVPQGIRTPPSLVNIYKELATDIGLPIPQHGCLQSWAEQGVLLLNATLSVEAHQAGSHQNRGWETFTDKIISLVSEHNHAVVFLLWGSYAQKKTVLVDQQKHLILKAPHPSPLSAYRGFLGCQHFSKTNQYLQLNSKAPIDWRLPG